MEATFSKATKAPRGEPFVAFAMAAITLSGTFVMVSDLATRRRRRIDQILGKALSTLSRVQRVLMALPSSPCVSLA